MADPYRQRVSSTSLPTEIMHVVLLSTLLTCALACVQDNPFADSTLYELNTTYVPPDLSETVDAVVPAVQPAAVPSPQPAAATYRSPAATPPAVAGPAVPAAGGTVPALPFTGVLLASVVRCNIGPIAGGPFGTWHVSMSSTPLLCNPCTTCITPAACRLMC